MKSYTETNSFKPSCPEFRTSYCYDLCNWFGVCMDFEDELEAFNKENVEPIIATPSNYDRLVESYVRIARENAELREENASLIKAVDNLDSANKKIGNELSEVRWALIKAQE